MAVQNPRPELNQLPFPLRVPRQREERPVQGSILDNLPAANDIRTSFHQIWGRIEEHLDLGLTSEEALELFQTLVIYDIPDGTRSTLTVDPRVDVGIDAGMFCVGLIHTLRALGAPSCLMMTHTAYNRARGEEGMKRILRIISEGARPMQEYASRTAMNVQLVGPSREYELDAKLRRLFPVREDSDFDAYFLVDYKEEQEGSPGAENDLAGLPEVDVYIRHTKLNLSGGGWIPGKLRKAAFLYSQNGALYSNWSPDELVALATLSLLAKTLNTGEGLVKMYGDIDEVKRRYQLRELRLYNQTVTLRPHPQKLFLMGSGLGLHQFYY